MVDGLFSFDLHSLLLYVWDWIYMARFALHGLGEWLMMAPLFLFFFSKSAVLLSIMIMSHR